MDKGSAKAGPFFTSTSCGKRIFYVMHRIKMFIITYKEDRFILQRGGVFVWGSAMAVAVVMGVR